MRFDLVCGLTHTVHILLGYDHVSYTNKFNLHDAEPVKAITSPKNHTTLHYNYLVNV